MHGVIEGRSVHYVAYSQRHLASIIIGGDFEQGTVNLAVFSDMPNVRGGVNMGLQFQAAVPFSEAKEPGTWHWIEGAPTNSYPSTPAEQGSPNEAQP